MVLDDFQPFAISLFIGLGAGLERERSQSEGETTSGVRTFALIALLGTIAARVDSQSLTAVLGLAIVALTTSGYWRATSRTADDGRRPDLGLTTEVAAAVVFGLGYLAARAPFLAGILGVATVSILHSRNRLHVFAHHIWWLASSAGSPRARPSFSDFQRP